PVASFTIPAMTPAPLCACSIAGTRTDAAVSQTRTARMGTLLTTVLPSRALSAMRARTNSNDLIDAGKSADRLARGRTENYVGICEELFTCPSSAPYIYSDRLQTAWDDNRWERR